MKELENLLSMTKRLHDALSSSQIDMAEVDMATDLLIGAAKLVEAAGAIGPEDRLIAREITILSCENERLAASMATHVATLLDAVRLNHR